MTYLPDGCQSPPAWPPPQALLPRLAPGLTESGDTGSNPTAQSPLAWPLGPRPAEEEANVTPGRSPPSSLGPGELSDTHRGGESGRDARRRRSEHSPPRRRSSASFGPGWAPSLVFSFGPTSGAQRGLIVRDWKTGVAPAESSAAHAGNARRAEGPPASSPAPPRPPPRRPAHFRRRRRRRGALTLRKTRVLSSPGVCAPSLLPGSPLAQGGGETQEGNLWFSEGGAEPRPAAAAAG